VKVLRPKSSVTFQPFVRIERHTIRTHGNNNPQRVVKDTTSISISLIHYSCPYVSSKEQWLMKCTWKYWGKSSCMSWKKRDAITCLSIKREGYRIKILNFHYWNFASKLIDRGGPFRWQYLSCNLTPLDFLFCNVYKLLYLRTNIHYYFVGTWGQETNSCR